MTTKFYAFVMCVISVAYGSFAKAHDHTQHAIMSYTEYAKKRHTSPYMFELSKENQHLFYCGASHSCDPNDKLYPALESFWESFLQKTQGTDCVVLVEGSLRNLHESTCTTEAIRRAGGEGGFITFLAQQSNIPVACPEPNEHYVLQQLQEQFSQEQIAYMRLAQVTLSAIRSKKVNHSVSLEEYIESFCATHQGFFSIPLTLEMFKNIHNQLFDAPLVLDDEKFFYQITNPVADTTIINKVCRRASIIRDRHIVDYIRSLLQEGKNVFIVYGHTHAVMQEPAIKSFWR
jgi:hypothetical protein